MAPYGCPQYNLTGRLWHLVANSRSQGEGAAEVGC